MGLSVRDDVDEAAWHDNDFADLLAFEEGNDLLVGEGGFFHRLVVRVLGHRDLRAELAHHLHRDRDLVVDKHGLFVGWPIRVGDGGGIAELGPEFLGEVGREGRKDAREAVELVAGEGFTRVDELEDRGDRGVEGQLLDVRAGFGDEAVELFFRRFIGGARDGDRAVFVGAEAPDFLEQSVQTHDVARIPRLARFEGSHVHLVEAEGVGAVVGDHIVGVDNILEGLGHLRDDALDWGAGRGLDVGWIGFCALVDDLVDGDE